MTGLQVTVFQHRMACVLRKGDVISHEATGIREAAVIDVWDKYPDEDETALSLKWDGEDGHHFTRFISVKREEMVTLARAAGEPPPGDEATKVRAAQRAACAALRCLLWKAGVPLLAWTIDDVTGLLSAQAHTGEELQAWAGFLGTGPETNGGLICIDATYMDVPVHVWGWSGGAE